LTASILITSMLGPFSGAAGAQPTPPPDPTTPPSAAAGLSPEATAVAEAAPEQGLELEQAVLVALDEGGSTDFWVDFEDRAELAGASGIEDWASRGQQVYDRLIETARASQEPVIGHLEASGTGYEAFWITNTLLVQNGDLPVLNDVLAQPGVAEIRADSTIELPDPIEAVETADDRIAAVEWGIANIRADSVWADFDVRGEGIVVGNIDTGVQYTHPALVNQYRGNHGGGVFDHNRNWWDPSNVCPSPEPCDNNNHGTHTMGTMVGDDGTGNQVGVAPGAQWIAAKGCENRTCSEAALLSAGQFMLAPTDLAGHDPRPEQRPHIVNNSWGGPSGDTWYDDVVAAWVAAGMFPVFSNGNSGPACGTAGSPGDGPNAYAAGAHDTGNVIASFSSRGPGRNGNTRPSISAPGVGVRSSVVDGYGLGSGTSMAAPHVSGTVALIWSASDLAGDVVTTREALDATAVDTEDLACGGTADNNNVYGQGRLDALEASIRAAIHSGLTGIVIDGDTGQPVPDVTISGAGSRAHRTDSDGRYTARVEPGRYTLSLSRFGYVTATVPDVVVSDDTFTQVDVELQPAASGGVAGRVTNADSAHSVPGVTVTIVNVPADLTATTDGEGEFEIPLIPVGSYQIEARTRWATVTQQIVVTAGATAVVDLRLPPPYGLAERVSVSSEGIDGNARTTNGNAISGDGRYVAFFSEATNLVDQPVKAQLNVYVHDRLTGVTELVSVSDNGAAADGSAWNPSISSDGRYVAFVSSADNLADDPPPGNSYYVRDRVTGETTVVSAEIPGESMVGTNTPISPDGRYVMFGTGTVEFVDPSGAPAPHPVCRPRPEFPGRSGLCGQGYVHDRQTGETELVTVNNEGEAANASAGAGQITPDGRFVSFGPSDADNLVDAGPNRCGGLYVRDRVADTTQFVELLAEPDCVSGVQFSDDFRHVVYGKSGFLAQGGLLDRATGETRVLEVPADGATLAGSIGEQISGDGNHVAFSHFAFTDSFELLPDATGWFTLDVDSGEIHRLIDTHDGSPWDIAADQSGPQAMSRDGRFVLAGTAAANLIPRVGNDVQHLYVVDRGFDPAAPQAQFAVWDLSVDPREPLPGQTVTLTASVKNVGVAAGTYEAVPLVDSVVELSAAEAVTLAPGEATEVVVSLTRWEGGTYQARLGPTSSEFRVQSGTASGTITDANDDAPIEGATVTAVNSDSTRTATTFAGGAYELSDLELGTWTVTVDADNYTAQTTQVSITEDGQRLEHDAALPTGLLSADPDAVHVALPAGSQARLDVTLRNTGTAGLGWDAFGWEASTPRSPAVLVYSHDPVHLGPDSYIDRALRRLELDYVGYYGRTCPNPLFDPSPPDRDIDLFQTALQATTWDLVIVSNECLHSIPQDILDALHTYVTSGGALIFFDGVSPPQGTDPLRESLGGRIVQIVSYAPPSGFVYWWEPDHPLVNSPLPIPEFRDPPGRATRLQPLDTARAVAGYTTATLPEMAALVVGNDGRTLLRAIGDVTNEADRNGNGVRDGEELWVNSIVHVGALAVWPWMDLTDSGTLAPGAGQDVTVSIDATNLGPGVYTGEVLLSANTGRQPGIAIPITVEVTPSTLLSLQSSATVGGVDLENEDIIVVGTGGEASMYFDGSDVGLRRQRLDAFARLDDGSLVLSFTAPAEVPGVPGTVDDSDLVRFFPESLGEDTEGTFELYFDGSDVGLTTGSEDVDAVDVLDDGRIVLSTLGKARIEGIFSRAEDLLLFTPNSLGEATEGTFELYFDGSDVGLTTGNENVDAVDVLADGRLTLSTSGHLRVPRLTAGRYDAVLFAPSMLGPRTAGAFDPTPLVDGSALGLRRNDVTGVTSLL
jgi:subtilisin family serine protease/Tol biopolymer transport system component